MNMDMSSAASSVMAMATSTATKAAAAATSSAAAMAGMSMGGPAPASGPACKISMLWNWYTIDSCFIARSWHVRSKGGFAGSCIGVVLLGMAVELVRRLQREYDRNLLARHAKSLESTAATTADSPEGSVDHKHPGEQSFVARMFVPTLSTGFTPSFFQQAIRALFYVVQYAGAYFIMLLAMYYNGYIIICIFIGGYLGNFFFGGDSFQDGGIKTQKTCCC